MQFAESFTPVAEARSLNNQGIRCIENSLFQEATFIISKGISIVRRFMQESENTSIGNDYDDEDFSSYFPFAPVIRQREYQDGKYIHLNPIAVNEDVADTTCCLDYCVDMSFVLLYNLALVHHLRAMTMESNASVLFQALHLYELAYSVRLNEELGASCHHVMALLNNMGQIYSILDEPEKSTICFRDLLSTLLMIQGTDADSKTLDDFLGSVMHLILEDVSASAA